MKRILNYINGEFKAPHGNLWLDNYDPSVGEVYSQIPDSREADVSDAVAAAKNAFDAWSSLSTEKRSKYLLAISEGIQKRLTEFAEAESRDNGKPTWLATKVDIPRAVSNFKFFAQAITQFSSESHAMGSMAINYTLRKPLGVVSCISPWNLPLYLFSWKIAPALATGNTVVAKPSEVTPMTAYLLSEVCKEINLPPGVLNIVHGLGPNTGHFMSIHSDVKAISFTGGTKTGSVIAQNAAPKFKKLSLELGGKNPNIIFDDCDYEDMLSTTIRSSFANQGQICLCGSRILVQETIYEKFIKDFTAKVAKLKVGDPFDSKTNVGAIVSKPHYEKILSYIKLAKDEGGTILTGGKSVFPKGHEKGLFIRPTIITDLPQTCRTNQEEIFGPVVTVDTFKTEEEALEKANCTEYGLSATLWTSNLKRAHRFSRDLHAGIVWVNTWLLRDLRTPFGGVKNSGVGREGGFEALQFFTEPKNICIKY